jgi:hypothetical protein
MMEGVPKDEHEEFIEQFAEYLCESVHDELKVINN